MKIRTSIIIMVLTLASCMSSNSTSLTATSIPVNVEVLKTYTPTIHPTATEFVDPLLVPTPVNTPHIIPTSIGQVTQKESFDLYNARVETFRDSLQFRIRILDVSPFTVENVTLYSVKAEGVITNVSNMPVVIGRTLRTGFTLEPQVYWGFTYNGKQLEDINCCVDGILTLSEDDYIVLQPGEFQKYAWSFSLPLEMRDSEKQDINLSGKPITIVAAYTDYRIGFDSRNKDGSLFTTTDESGETIFYTVDMNAWVGEILSNSITYVFP